MSKIFNIFILFQYISRLLVRNIRYDAKQVLLYCGIRIPPAKDRTPQPGYKDMTVRFTRGTKYGIIQDPVTARIHFEPDYIQDIIDQATRFDFPVYDKSFGPGGCFAFRRCTVFQAWISNRRLLKTG